MKKIQEIEQGDFEIKVYYTDNVDLEKYNITDLKVAQVVFSFLDQFKEMIKFRDKFNFKVQSKEVNYIFTYTDDLLLLIDVIEQNDNTKEDEMIEFNIKNN